MMLQMHAWITRVAAVALLAVLAAPLQAQDVQVIRSPGGIEAWVVESPGIPMLALEIRIPGGASAEPEDQPGVTRFMASLLGEGAGDLDAAAFSARADALALRMSVEAGRDAVSVSARMLTETLDDSLDLLRLALTAPRFDAEAVERVRGGLSASLRAAQARPETRADQAWREALYPQDPYGRPSDGTEASIAALDVADLRAAQARALHRQGLAIGVVGDIDAQAVGPLLDRLLGDLPETGPAPLPPAEMSADRGVQVVAHDAPQSLIRMVADGVARDDPDFIPAFVANHILGGGGFTSRLTREVRERRGLTYGVFSYLAMPDRGPLLVAGLATDNARAAEALALVRAEMSRMRDAGADAEELAAAQRYLTGAWPLRFDSNAKIAAQLAGLMSVGESPDYLTRRNDLVNAVTLEDVARAARRLFDPDRFHVVVVGRPEGLEATPSN